MTDATYPGSAPGHWIPSRIIWLLRPRMFRGPRSVAGNIRSEDGKDLFLAVGEFYDHTRLYLVETDGPENLPADG